MTSLTTSRPSGQHFSQSKKSRTFPARDLERMTESDVWALFKQIRWSDTDGKPVCPKCKHPESLWLANQHRRKCKGCRHQFSVTSSTILAYKRMDIREVFRAARMFTMMPKGLSAIAISHELSCDYQSAWVLEHKFREAMLHSLQGIDRLHGTIEVDGCWVGGYIKPENEKINRVDRRLASMRSCFSCRSTNALIASTLVFPESIQKRSGRSLTFHIPITQLPFRSKYQEG